MSIKQIFKCYTYSIHIDKLSILSIFLGGRRFQDRVSLYCPGSPGTHSLDQTGLKLRNAPASASQVLGLKMCVITAWLYCLFFKFKLIFILFYFLHSIFNSSPPPPPYPVSTWMSHPTPHLTSNES